MHDINLAGVGIGPSNLSIAALLHGIEGVRATFFERREAFAWHPGLMFPAARMQTSFLKDLVTAVDPTSVYSFVNYLVRHGRFYPFMTRERACVGRREFSDYLAWVAGELDGLRFGVDVRELRSSARGFELIGDDGLLCVADHVCVGTGRAARVPACARPFLGERCLHGIDIMERALDVTDRTVAVVGGGQTGAEVALELLRGRWGQPSRLQWISRRLNFEPLDESPFTNQLFTPSYVRMFHGLSARTRAALLEQQRLAGDGISPATLGELHDEIYERIASGRGHTVALLPGRELVAMSPSFVLDVHRELDDVHEQLQADVVLLCTGLDDRLAPCLEGLAPRLELDDGHLAVGTNFAVSWDGPAAHRIYVVNAGRHALGIAESQLSLMAWRSATIINDLLGRPHFDTEDHSMVRWSPADDPSRASRASSCAGEAR